jgi:hypothetical protein
LKDTITTAAEAHVAAAGTAAANAAAVKTAARKTLAAKAAASKAAAAEMAGILAGLSRSGGPATGMRSRLRNPAGRQPVPRP